MNLSRIKICMIIAKSIKHCTFTQVFTQGSDNFEVAPLTLSFSHCDPTSERHVEKDLSWQSKNASINSFYPHALSREACPQQLPCCKHKSLHLRTDQIDH